jgi:hypothetical protein
MLKLAVVCSCCHGWTRFGVFLSCLPATSRANTSQAVVNEGAGGAGGRAPPPGAAQPIPSGGAWISGRSVPRAGGDDSRPARLEATRKDGVICPANYFARRYLLDLD